MNPRNILVNSKENPGTMYRVDLILNECTCTGFKFRGNCSHLEKFKK